MFTKKILAKVVVALTAAVMVLGVVGCGAKKGPQVTIEVKGADGSVSTFTGNTDAEFLMGAIEDIEGVTIDGYESDWGYYITTVNGTVADYDADGAYWSIYVNGEYGMNGVETQPVADGDVFTFAYEVYEEAQ